MIRSPLARALSLASSPTRYGTLVGVQQTQIRSTATTPAKLPEKIEVFVDDQSVMVDPGTTVLQVNIILYFLFFNNTL